MEKCPIDMENAHYDEMLYFMLYGKPGVLKDDDPVLLAYRNQRLPPEEQVPLPELETDDSVVLHLLGKKELPEPPHILEKLPDSLKRNTEDEDLPVYRRSYILNFNWSTVKGEYRALDYDKYIEVDESRPTTRMCRLLTMVIFKLLVYLEQYLESTLKKCRSDVSMINDKIEEYKCPGSDIPNKLSWLNMYGMPYFKDKQYFTCQPNEDVQRKKYNGELLVSELITVTDWNNVDCHRLEQAIRSEEVKRRSEKVRSDRKKLLMSLNEAKTEEEREELREKMNAIPSLESIKAMSLKELCDDIEWEYDWLKVAAQDYNGQKHPEECRSVWRIYLHPQRNRGPWTNEENEKLKELVKYYRFQNWETIAEKLGTNRTPLMVMQHYQRNLNEGFTNKAWTHEDDELLKKLVQTCRVGSRISWKQIAQHMKGYTKEQIFKRWHNHMNPSICKGPFSENEDMLLVVAIRNFGEDYSKLLELFPYRSREHLRNRYKALTKLHRNTWGPAENEKLLSLVERFGKDKWKKISQYFNDQSPASLKEQYNVLKYRMLTEDNYDLLEDSEKISEEDKLWRRAQQLYPSLKESKLDQRKLKGLKESIVKNAEMIPPSTRTVTHFEKQCYTYFKSVSNPDMMYDNDLYEYKKRLDKPHVLKFILHLLNAKLHIPSHPVSPQGDKYLLQELSKESFTVPEGGDESANDGLHLRYSMPPNITTISGFCSLLLHRLYVLDEQQQKKKEEIVVEAEEADQLFKKRFRFLFLWPALASVESPAIGEPPPLEDYVLHTIRQPARRGRKKNPTRVELLNIIGPKGKLKQTYGNTKRKRKRVVSIDGDMDDTAASSCTVVESTSVATPSTSRIDSINDCPLIEIKDESIYQTLLASEQKKKQQTNISLPSTSSCVKVKQEQMKMELSATSPPRNVVLEKKKQQTDTAFPSSSSSTSSPSTGTFSFNSAKCIRTYSRVKKPRTQP